MLLQEELKDSDIPHRTTIRKCIKEIWDEHLAGLESEIKVLKIQLISIVMGTQFIIILPIARSQKGFLDHWHVVWFQPCFFHSHHRPLDWDERHADPQWASIWIETACRADRLSQSSRSSYRWTPCSSCSLHPWPPFNHIKSKCATAISWWNLVFAGQIGWVTMDNATNNDTLMASLGHELHAQWIVFDHVENRIR